MIEQEQKTFGQPSQVRRFQPEKEVRNNKFSFKRLQRFLEPDSSGTPRLAPQYWIEYQGR